MRKILLLYLEPTPYILGLIREIGLNWNDRVDTIFLGQNLSQQWGQELMSESMAILPHKPMNALRALSRRLKSGEYELVHLAGWGHPLLLATLLLARMRGIPVTIESDTPMPYAGAAWKKAVKRMLYPWLFRLPAFFLPGGSRQAAYLRHYGVPDQRIMIAKMTVDTEAISAHVDAMDDRQRLGVRTVHHLSSDVPVFLYAGRLEPHKGLQELIDAFRRLSALEDLRAQLLIVGDGSMQEQIAEAASRNDRIHYAGRLSGSALLDAYGVADVLVLPSRFEPWGLVVNEAMAAGLPVIATDHVGCIDDLVIQDETGLIVPAGSENALVDAITRLASDQALRDCMTRNARALIAQWSLKIEAEIVTRAWKKILET